MGEKLLLDRITYNPKIFGGKPIIGGDRQTEFRLDPRRLAHPNHPGA